MSTNIFISIIIVLLVVSNVLAVTVAYYLYRWRKRTEDGEKLVVIPDEMFNSLDANSKNINSLRSSQEKYINGLVKELNLLTQESRHSTSKVFDFLTDIQKLADERLAEIQRFQDGYDFIKLQNFINQIIRLLDDIDKELNKTGLNKDDLYATLKDLRDELLILLENNNIKEIRPEVGQPYLSTSLEYKVVSRISPDEPQDSESIHQVIRPGYKIMITDKEPKILREAEITVNRTCKETEGYENG